MNNAATTYCSYFSNLDHSLILRVIIPDVVLIQLSSWGWARSCLKHVEDSNEHVVEEIVRQVGYLPEWIPISEGTSSL
jgi:hypothetical protein